MNITSNQLAIAVSFFVGLPLFIYTLISVDISQVRQLSATIKPLYLLGYLLLSVATLIVYTHIWRLFLVSYDKHFFLPALKLFNFRMVGFAISYVTPGPRWGGEITRGSLLSSHTDQTQKTATMAAFMEMFTILVAGLIFDTAMVAIGLLLLPKSWLLQITLAILITLLVLMPVGWYGLIEKRGGRKLIDWLGDLISIPTWLQADPHTDEPEHYAKNHLGTFMRGIGWCLLTKVFIGMQMYLLLAALSVQITFLQALLLAATIDIAYTIPSYMGLGALEAGQSGILSLIGGVGAASAGVVLAFITRLRDITFSGYGLAALTYYSSNGTSNSEG